MSYHPTKVERNRQRGTGRIEGNRGEETVQGGVNAFGGCREDVKFKNLSRKKESKVVAGISGDGKKRGVGIPPRSSSFSEVEGGKAKTRSGRVRSQGLARREEAKRPDARAANEDRKITGKEKAAGHMRSVPDQKGKVKS